MKLNRRTAARNRMRLLLESLETRTLPCVVGPDGQVIPDADGDYVVGSPPINDPSAYRHDVGNQTSAFVPALSSRPGAPASLYLNFSGDNVASWLGYQPGVIPAFT